MLPGMPTYVDYLSVMQAPQAPLTDHYLGTNLLCAAVSNVQARNMSHAVHCPEAASPPSCHIRCLHPEPYFLVVVGPNLTIQKDL